MDRVPVALSFNGLELLSTAVIVVDRQLMLRHANPAAEDLFGFSVRTDVNQPLSKALPGNPALHALVRQAFEAQSSFSESSLALNTQGGAVLHAACHVTPVETDAALAVLEFRALDQQLRIAREEKLLELQQLNKELMRNLAHEIKNPLGGIRGAAQLLERELPSADLTEYTQVIVKEADRLQTLMDRLLTPNRIPQIGPVNIHEVLERVRTLILAEFPGRIAVRRDYDISLPDLTGDKEQLIQALLNIVRNAAQAMNGEGDIRLITRIVRNVTLARHRYRHVIEVKVVDNGPGVPDDLRDKIFYPLVTGRDGGTGLGLPLAQGYIHQHGGVVEFSSQPGHTCFSVLLPLAEGELVPRPVRDPRTAS
ncbi:MAG: PAS domain-containing protein [Betaproteobacteria bacterium]|nr:PAS domain-containing protein [Betaproteobacteria bacterium]